VPAITSDTLSHPTCLPAFKKTFIFFLFPLFRRRKFRAADTVFHSTVTVVPQSAAPSFLFSSWLSRHTSPFGKILIAMAPLPEFVTHLCSYFKESFSSPNRRFPSSPVSTLLRSAFFLPASSQGFQLDVRGILRAIQPSFLLLSDTTMNVPFPPPHLACSLVRTRILLVRASLSS